MCLLAFKICFCESFIQFGSFMYKLLDCLFFLPLFCICYSCQPVNVSSVLRRLPLQFLCLLTCL